MERAILNIYYWLNGPEPPPQHSTHLIQTASLTGTLQVCLSIKQQARRLSCKAEMSRNERGVYF